MKEIPIADYDYDLPEDRIARFPLPERDASKLLVYRGGELSQARFSELPDRLPADSLVVFNDTKVVRARILFFKETGARIEIFCLEPHEPADHERAFARTGSSVWRCIVGGAKKWKEGELTIPFEHAGRPARLAARRLNDRGSEPLVAFSWDAELTFGQLLERLGRIPIPPYLNRESEESDNARYQTVYSRVEGSVAAPTAGLHFTDRVIAGLHEKGIESAEVTLHVGAGTFLPVKTDDAARHAMHTEHFEATTAALRRIGARIDRVVAVGTTAVRTLESLAVLGWRVIRQGDPEPSRPVGQWEAYEIPDELTGEALIGALADCLERTGRSRIRAATQIMITPAGFRFRVVRGLVTNFHQPKSTLLLLVSAFTGGDWKRIYDYALSRDFRFLSYGDSSLLLP
jgi:S-adenosylmethionine:tRNA ribosyltransferase-isomerase